MDEIKAEIDALDLYLREGVYLPNVHPIVYEIAPHLTSKRIFLQDGDALVYPYQGLIEILQYLNKKFPWLERIATYATPQDLLRRSVEELKALRAKQCKALKLVQRCQLLVYYYGKIITKDKSLDGKGHIIYDDQDFPLWIEYYGGENGHIMVHYKGETVLEAVGESVDDMELRIYKPGKWIGRVIELTKPIEKDLEEYIRRDLLWELNKWTPIE